MRGNTAHAGSSRLASRMMWICCIAMPVAAIGYFVWLPAEARTWAQAATLAPLLLCGAAHLAIMASLGRSCHGPHEQAEVIATTDCHERPARPITVPQITEGR